METNHDSDGFNPEQVRLFVCLKKVANFSLAIGTRFSKLERIGIILETNHGSDGFNPERVCFFEKNSELSSRRWNTIFKIGKNWNKFE